MAAVFAPIVPLILLLYVALVLCFVVAGWKVFAKAGQPGWGIFVPIFNLYLVCKIAGRPEWWVILMFIPLVNVVIALILAMDIAQSQSPTSLSR